MKTTKLFLNIICLLSIAVYGQTKESSLWGPNGSNWDSAGRLPDFSYAGYHSSEKQIPNVPIVANLKDFGANPNDSTDDSVKLQQLINQQTSVSKNNPGAILIPKGRWIIDNPITISRSGLVLRGEVDTNGKPLTEFYFPNSTSNKTDFHINMNGSFNLTTIGKISANTNQGSKTFTLNYSSSARLAVGDFLQLTQQDESNESLAKYLHGNIDNIGKSTKDLSFYPKLFYWYAKVKAVNGNTITVDRPLPIKVQTSWTPTISKFNVEASKTEMGIENIIFNCNNNQKFVHNDYRGFRVLALNEVVNCWVKNVELVDTEYGIRIQKKSCYNSITKVVIRDEQINVTIPNLSNSNNIVNTLRNIGGDHHPLEVVYGFYNLIENFEFKNICWHELSVEGAAAYNVFRNGKGIAVAFDNHRNAPYSNLWTNIDIGRPERMWFNSGSNQIGVPGRERGPHCGFRTTYWNVKYQKQTPGAALPVAVTDGFSYLNCVGIPGATKATSPAAKVNSQLIEINGANESVAQPDLFIAQLNKRKNNSTPTNNPPVVDFTLPSTTSFVAPATLVMNVSATDNDPGDNIANVKLYKNGTFVRQENIAPYDWNHTGQDAALQNLAAGTYTFKAVATDSKGATGEKSITITVTSATNPCTGVANPSVSITSPSNNSNYTQGQNVTITATASSTVAITKVEFYKGTTLVGTDTSAPYTFTSNSLSIGTHNFTAKAYNSCNKIATSTTVAVKINAVVTPQGDISGPSCSNPLQTLTFQINPALTANATNYNWFFRGAKESLTTSNGGRTCTLVTTKGFGEICVGVRYSSGTSYVEYCKTISNCSTISARTMTDEDTIILFPNPSKDGLFHIQLQTKADVTILIQDIIGNKIFEEQYKNQNSIFNQEIDFSKVEKGTYFITTTFEGKISTTRLLIE